MFLDLLNLDPLAVCLICALVFLAGFVDAIAGGGGLISLPAYLIAGLPVHNALATNKLSSCMGTSIAAFRYARLKLIPWKTAAACIICALIGGSAGASLALAIPEEIFLVIMVIALPAVAFVVIRGKVFNADREPLARGRMLLIACASALVIGIYDGLYGPGTGTFLILLLTGAAHMGLGEANGVTKAINLSTNASSLAVFLLSGKTVVALGLLAGVFSIAGNWLGTVLFTRVGARSVRPIMLAVLVIFFAKVVGELSGII